MKCDYGHHVASNTRLLYARLAISTAVEMVVARWVLDALGVDDYGSFAAAFGGLGAFFFFNGALEAAARRFICHDRQNFAPLLGLTLTLSGVVGFLGILFSSLVFSLPLSLLLPLLGVLVLRLLRLPYDACIVASEKMGFFLVLSIVESGLSLLSALSISYLPFCPLTAYAALRFTTAALVTLIVLVFCRYYNEESRIRPSFQWNRTRPLLGFFSWHALGAVAGLLKGSGIIILLAMYAGMRGCAACETAAKITTLLWGLIANYRMAYLPGVVKAWADGDEESFVCCTARAFRCSTFGMALVTIPILIWAPQISAVWLGSEVPSETAMFMRMFALQFFIEALATPLDTAILATGRIARYEIVLTALIGSSFFFAWAALSSGLPAWTATGSVALVNLFAFLYRFVHLRRYHGISIRAWFCRYVA